MKTLVYVHGTNGSGKSTLARAVLAAAGGAKGLGALACNPKATWTHTGRAGVVLVGKYLTSCGGVDGVQPYADVRNILCDCAGEHVFAEGLVTPGKDTCAAFANQFDRAVFILLDTPETVCITNVLKRRKAKGNDKPYSPDNLYKKARSARMWADSLERTGLEVQRLQYRQAYKVVLELLGLPTPSVDDLL